MKKYRTRKKRFYFLLVALFVVSMGLGYAVLTQQLDIDNTVSYDAMKWDVGFYNAEPLDWAVESVIPTVSISSDKKTVYISCDFGTSTTSKECSTMAVIRNDSTFNVELYTDPNITFNSNLIKDVHVNWFYEFITVEDNPSAYEDEIVKGFVMPAGGAEIAIITIFSNDLTVDMLPSSVISVPISIQLDWQQTEKDAYDTGMSSYEEGNVISIGDEKFNVITSTPTTVTMLAQKSLGSDYRQSSTPSYVNFSDNNDWISNDNPIDIDVQQYNTNVGPYLNEYTSYLKSVTGDSTLVADLISLNQLKYLGCTIRSYDYSPTDGDTCADSPYYSWLINADWWWTKSAWNTKVDENTIWFVTDKEFYLGSGVLYDASFWWYSNDGWNPTNGFYEGDYKNSTASIRPVITISKDKLRKYLN